MCVCVCVCVSVFDYIYVYCYKYFCVYYILQYTIQMVLMKINKGQFDINKMTIAGIRFSTTTSFVKVISSLIFDMFKQSK